MNKNIYRLIFSKHLQMFVPAAETTSGHAGKSSCSLARSRRRALLALGTLALLPTAASMALAAQPAGLVPHATQIWSNAAIDAARSSANQMTIQQTAPKAILNWQQLNLNKGQTLNFDQQGNRSWAALNRIYDANPSLISGNVNAPGHIYFVNSNGIIFGNGAQINVGSLTATSLDISDTLFKDGVVSNAKAASFGLSGEVNNGFVRVEAGAALTSDTGGRVMLLAPEVTNSGVITTPEGQTILAAGQKVYLAKSDDPAGLLVEVDAGGSATNLGEIVARLGNVSMVGLAVNQQGRVSASTSVRANGSIRLLARDTVTVNSATDEHAPQHGGVLTLGKNSVTQIDVETADKEEIFKSQLTDKLGNKVLGVSKVEMSAGVIDIEGSIIAHGGDVSAIAAANPSIPADSGASATRVFLGENALIDVSGLDASAPMSRNQLEIQLYSEQLKDTPLLRGTSMVGKTIYVDARNGTDLISADALDAAKAIKGISIAEVMSKGGTVKLESALGDVIKSAGSSIDVSGGSVTYAAGNIRESQLIYKGKAVAIAKANKNTPYEGLADSYSVTDKKWGVTRTWDLGSVKGRYNTAYTQGSDAGALSFVAQNAVLQGDFRAYTQPGYTQRSSPPAGGSFSFTLTPPSSGDAPTFRLVADKPEPIKLALDEILPGADILLDTQLFAQGFSQLKLDTSGGAIVVDAPVHTAAKGSVSLTTLGQAMINADIVAPGGSIVISGGDTRLADHVTISASGLYTNDTAGMEGALQNAVLVDGGSISIAEKDVDKGGLTLGDGVVLAADAGAWLGANGKLSGGKGGSVTLNGVSSLGNAEVSAFGFGKGGSLALSVINNLQAGGQNPASSDTLWLPEAFFARGGFAKYTLETLLPDSQILIGDAAASHSQVHSEIHPQTQVLVAKSGYRNLASGTDIKQVASTQLPADWLRKPASLAFKSAGSLTLAENATIRLDAPGLTTTSTASGGAIGLQSIGQMSILGSLIAPAGNISAAVTGKMSSLGYDNHLSLFVGSNALLSAAGQYAVSPSNNGLLNASVQDAGSISLDGGERAVVVLKEGSVLDVAGASGQMDVALGSGYARQTRFGAAGNIDISARNGLVLDGAMHGDAAGTGRDGSLTLTFKGGDDPDENYPNGARVLTVTQNKINRGTGLQAGDALEAIIGSGAISAGQIADAGFARVKLDVDRSVAGDKVLLSAGLNLQVQEALTLKTSLLEVADGGKAVLKADYVALGGDSSVIPDAGTGELQVDGKWIDLIGDMAVGGVNKTTLAADLDIRARGTRATIEGSLVTPGAMVLRARQIYPVTNGAFRFETTGSNNSIEVKPGAVAASTVPLSAAGKLTLKADNIIQGGVLRAPLGQITLDADDTLTLKAGSLTSVSALSSDGTTQLIPYGLTRLGGLDLLAPTTDLLASVGGDAPSAMPDKKITLKAASLVDMKTGASVDISGGGDTLAYEWIDGIGGSSDILGQAGVYAVLPTLQGEYAAFDYNYSQPGLGINAGDAVYLSHVPGLADGNYTLLPARYALLPGAFMVQTSGTTLTSGSSAAQLDGSTLVSAYKLNGASRDALDSTFKVTSGSIFHTAKGEISHAASEYRLTQGNQFFTKLAADKGTRVPPLATDAGQLVIDAASSLVLDADVLANKPTGARGALVDIVSGQIKVVSSVDEAFTGALQLTASSLNNLKAESLLLGGVRTQSGNDYNIATGASSVAFANDDAHALQVTELMAAASDTLTVEANAKINTLASNAPVGSTKLHASGDGALLAVSALNDIEFDRSGASNAIGSLDIAGNAQISAHISMVLDATAAANLKGAVKVADAGTITLGANRVVLGAADASVSGLRVSDSLLGSFGQLSKVTLNSYKNIDIYGPVNLGNDKLDLTLNAGGIGGHMGDNQTAILTAKNFTLKNSLGASFEAASAANGSQLQVNASNIQLAGAASATATATTSEIGGFEHVDLNAGAEAVFSGSGTTTINAAQTTITSARITAATGTDYALTATGGLTTGKAATAAVLPDTTGLGAKLTLTGADVTLGGNVELSSGKLIAQATSGNLTLAADASIKAASVPVKFDKYTQYTPGGTVTLQADQGNVSVNNGAVVDVSGGVGGTGGTLRISAKNGATSVLGSLKGQAAAGQQAGSFVLDSKTLPDFSGLNTALNAGGFNATRDLRIRTGDLTIAGSDTVTAHHVVLSADDGKVDVAGTVDASGSNGGKVEIYARDNVTLKSSGQLLARGTGDTLVAGDKRTGAGGRVVLSSLSTASVNAISAESGALIDVSGDEQGAVSGEKGSVTMRAYRGTTGNTDTVNVAFDTTAAVKGAAEVRLEGVKVYNSATFAANTSTIVADTNAFYNANPGSGSYVATQDGAVIKVLPNIEVRSTSTSTPTDLTIAADLNMRDFGDLQAGKGGSLTLRANKDLKINGSLSDGFDTATTAGVLQSGNTFSFDLVAGADFSAANSMATVKDAGSFTLANSKLIRTGEGNIRIASGGNLTMGNESSVIYTVGQAAADFDNFTQPTTANSASYLTNGGDIDIHTQGNILGKIGSSGGQQLISPWLFRQGGGSGGLDVSWWVRPDLFKQGVAALGGGNVSVNAEGSITNFSVSVPTTARYDNTGNVSLNGGGDVQVTAGGDITSGVYFAGKGNVNLTAGGEIKAAANTFGTTIALQDASAKVSAVKRAMIETVFNPTLWSQVKTNAEPLDASGNNAYLLTYGEDSAFRLDSLTGNATLGSSDVSRITSDLVAGTNNTNLKAALEIHPGTVEAVSFSADVKVGQMILAPSAQGNLGLFAAGNVLGNGDKALIAVSDADASLLPSVVKPVSQYGGFGSSVITQFISSHAATALHTGDTKPLVIIARDGSITLPGSESVAGLTSPKAAYIRAGTDISLSADIQHLDSQDITVISAGRDFIIPSNTGQLVQLGGSGELLVQAGRDVKLGTSKGIVTVANTVNPALAETGASITLLAGLGEQGADVATYVAHYIDPAGAGPSVLQVDATKLATYRSDTAQAVATYMRRQTGNSDLSEVEAMTQYLALDADRQAVFAYRHFSSELLASGKGFASTGHHQRGDTAIADLFPSNRSYNGDLSLFNSQLRTYRDGNIDILTPGGLINAGVPTSSGNDIGIVTERGGDIRAFAESGFQVEQSKVITQYGSDITVWVNNGDIDAGRGSKTAVSVPKRVVSTDADGKTTIEVKGVAAGSGIRAQSYDPDGPAGSQVAPALGNVALIAPRGVLNASEAGIAAGNFLAVATQVLGANNISVSGTSSGVAAADSGSLAGAMAGVSNVAADATKSIADDVSRQAASQTLRPKSEMPSYISVEVIGLGE